MTKRNTDMATGESFVTTLSTVRTGSRVTSMWLHIVTNDHCYHKEYTNKPFSPCDDMLVAFC